VVIGSGCSGHDIAQALWREGAASVTLVQRSATAVVSEDLLLALFPGSIFVYDALWDTDLSSCLPADLYTGKNIPPIDIADRLFLGLPRGAGKVVQNAVMQKIAPMDKYVCPIFYILGDLTHIS
jgi:hypothetical protein